MNIRSQKGFTLVELMIALLLSSLVLAAVGVAFRSQQRSYTAQEEVAEMQQELRAGMEIITRELRNAGHDMSPNKTAGAGFVAAGPFQVQFTMDLGDGVGGDPDGDINDADEDVTYALIGDADNNGIADAGISDLGRDLGGGLQGLVTNIHAIGFAYAYDDNGDGALETKNVGGVDQIIWAVPDGGGNWIDLDDSGDGVIDTDDIDYSGGGLGNATAIQLGQIRAVRIWILARASRVDPDYTDANVYKVGANVIAAPNDNFRRRLLTASVRCRNMGIVVP
jgi:type IV pilus assembly protein PilW